MYCHLCKKATCTTCMTEDHLGHKMDTIAKFSRKLINYRTQYLGDLTASYELKSRRKTRKFREVKCQNDSVLSNNVKSLENKREQLYHVVDELIDKELNTCQSRNTELAESFEKVEKKHIDEDGTVEKMLTVFEKTTMTGLGIIEYYEDLRSRVEWMESNVDVEQFCDRLVYHEGTVDKNKIHRMIGDVREAKKASQSLEQLSVFCYPESSVTALCPVSRDKAWVTWKGDKQFTLMHKDGEQLDSVPKEAANCGFYVKDDEIINGDYHKQAVLKIDHSGKASNIMDTSPLYPVDVGQAPNGNILVTLVDKWSRSRTAESERKAIMLTPGGEVLHEYQFGEDGSTPVLSFPTIPTQNFNSDICIVNDFTIAPKTYKGNICVFYEDGGLKFVYKGQTEKFRPEAICCDSLSNILCVDYSENNVHIVNSEGQFLRYLFTNESCVARPGALALYKSVLWIGSYKGEVRVYRYKE